MLFYLSAKVQGKREVVKVNANDPVEAVHKIEEWAKKQSVPYFRLTGSVLTLAAAA